MKIAHGYNTRSKMQFFDDEQNNGKTISLKMIHGEPNIKDCAILYVSIPKENEVNSLGENNFDTYYLEVDLYSLKPVAFRANSWTPRTNLENPQQENLKNSDKYELRQISTSQQDEEEFYAILKDLLNLDCEFVRAYNAFKSAKLESTDTEAKKVDDGDSSGFSDMESDSPSHTTISTSEMGDGGNFFPTDVAAAS